MRSSAKNDRTRRPAATRNISESAISTTSNPLRESSCCLASRRGSNSSTQCIAHRLSAGQQRGSDAEEQAGRERDGGRPEKNRRVDVHAVEIREPLRAKCDDRSQALPCDEQAEAHPR